MLIFAITGSTLTICNLLCCKGSTKDGKHELLAELLKIIELGAQTAAKRSTVSGNFSTRRIRSEAWAFGLALPCSQFSNVLGLVRR